MRASFESPRTSFRGIYAIDTCKIKLVCKDEKGSMLRYHEWESIHDEDTADESDKDKCGAVQKSKLY